MDVMVTMCPSPDAISVGSRACVTRSVPMTLVSNIHRQSSSSASATGSRPLAPPALLTSSFASGTAAAKAATDSASVTSRRTAVPSISAAISAQRSTRRAPSTTWNPASASARAVAAPMPELAPVTTAVGRSDVMRRP